VGRVWQLLLHQRHELPHDGVIDGLWGRVHAVALAADRVSNAGPAKPLARRHVTGLDTLATRYCDVPDPRQRSVCGPDGGRSGREWRRWRVSCPL
jgi:hypothetical protein